MCSSGQCTAIHLRLDRVSQFDCETWAREVIHLLSVNFARDERLKILKPLTDRASEFLSHLLIASMLFHLLESFRTHLPVARNPGRKKTPQQSVHSTPDMSTLRPILNLLKETTTRRSQSALMELLCHLLIPRQPRVVKFICDQLFWRDGSLCPFTSFSFMGPGRCVYPRSAHILPFSFQDKVRGIESQRSLIVILLHHSLSRLRRSKSLLDDSLLQN
jgi:hypothetical protein